jgi:nucleotidyltransferase substrate binding protein (TIGR01987 family)
MDQTLELKCTEFKQALKTFDEVLNKNFKTDIIIRDATIQRFEYSYELCWKTIKTWLISTHAEEILSPNETFRSACAHGLISPIESEEFLAMAKNRNLTTHTYNEHFINELVLHLPRYFQLMQKLADALDNSLLPAK